MEWFGRLPSALLHPKNHPPNSTIGIPHQNLRGNQAHLKNKTAPFPVNPRFPGHRRCISLINRVIQEPWKTTPWTDPPRKTPHSGLGFFLQKPQMAGCMAAQTILRPELQSKAPGNLGVRE
jgi:hypothetical protein